MIVWLCMMYDCWLRIFILCACVHCHRMYCNSEWCYGDTAYCNAMPCDIKAYQTMWVHAKKKGKKRHPNISQHISCIPMCLFPSSYEFFSLASTFICVWSSSLKHAPRWFASTGVIWGASRESLSIALLCTCRSPLDRETTEKPTKSTSIKIHKNQILFENASTSNRSCCCGWKSSIEIWGQSAWD